MVTARMTSSSPFGMTPRAMMNTTETPEKMITLIERKTLPTEGSHPGRRSRPDLIRSISIIASGTTIPRTMKDEATAIAAAMPKWMTDSIPDDVLARNAMPSEAKASASAPSTPPRPTTNALRGPNPSNFSSS